MWGHAMYKTIISKTETSYLLMSQKIGNDLCFSQAPLAEQDGSRMHGLSQHQVPNKQHEPLAVWGLSALWEQGTKFPSYQMTEKKDSWGKQVNCGFHFL